MQSGGAITPDSVTLMVSSENLKMTGCKGLIRGTSIIDKVAVTWIRQATCTYQHNNKNNNNNYNRVRLTFNLRSSTRRQKVMVKVLIKHRHFVKIILQDPMSQKATDSPNQMGEEAEEVGQTHLDRFKRFSSGGTKTTCTLKRLCCR